MCPRHTSHSARPVIQRSVPSSSAASPRRPHIGHDRRDGVETSSNDPLTGRAARSEDEDRGGSHFAVPVGVSRPRPRRRPREPRSLLPRRAASGRRAHPGSVRESPEVVDVRVHHQVAPTSAGDHAESIQLRAGRRGRVAPRCRHDHRRARPARTAACRSDGPVGAHHRSVETRSTIASARKGVAPTDPDTGTSYSRRRPPPAVASSRPDRPWRRAVRSTTSRCGASTGTAASSEQRAKPSSASVTTSTSASTTRLRP